MTRRHEVSAKKDDLGRRLRGWRTQVWRTEGRRTEVMVVVIGDAQCRHGGVGWRRAVYVPGLGLGMPNTGLYGAMR